MGNALPRIRHKATAPRSGATTPAPSGRTARRHGGKVALNAALRPRVVAEDDQRKAGGVGVVTTVKMMVTRKEAERLIARLEEHSAKERKARIAEITRRLRAGRDGRSPASCGGAWMPRLAPIQEI